MSEPIIFHTIPEQIAQRIRNDIITGKLKPGQPLREKGISELFGVSRGPIREVFRQLTQQGLLVTKPNKGVRVAEQPSASVRPLVVELRKTIESFVLENVFEQITEAHLTRWERILAEMKEACERGDTAALAEHDLQFHRAIVQSYQESDIVNLWQPVMLRMMIDYQRLGDLMESYYEHEKILNAIRRGDKEASIVALKENIQ
ncbi:MAG: GntR family transcriptional regulator [Chloroflexi bacterium]|nr:GntR family transcriptional regulator [Chloroflexota bacterium]